MLPSIIAVVTVLFRVVGTAGVLPDIEWCWLFEVNFDAKFVVKFLQASGLELSPGDKTESMFVNLKIIPETILSNGRGNLSGLLNKKTPGIVGQHVESPSMAGDDGVQNARHLE
jgi:hypothetical protein